MDQILKLYNTRTRKVEPFQPLGPVAKMYVCGPTVYDSIHLGNARPLVVFDVLYRLLHAIGHETRYARNITDIDDKIIAAMEKSGEDFDSFIERQVLNFHQSCQALGILKPTYEPRATKSIPEITAMISNLIAQGYAYENESGVYFETKKGPKTGILSRRDLHSEPQETTRRSWLNKKDHSDFALWKKTDEDPVFNSPWGLGRPGWHIECSAMINEVFRGPIDIHGGGIDLMFPHHENENTQSTCAHGDEQLSNVWMHNGQILLDGRKISKSEGNDALLKVLPLCQMFGGDVLRMILLKTHYRRPIDIDLYRTFMDASEDVTRLRNFLLQTREHTSKLSSIEYGGLLNDLNTPLAISELWEHISSYERSDDPALLYKIRGLIDVFGFSDRVTLPDNISVQIRYTAQLRANARRERNFELADSLRMELELHGYQVADVSDTEYNIYVTPIERKIVRAFGFYKEALKENEYYFLDQIRKIGLDIDFVAAMYRSANRIPAR